MSKPADIAERMRRRMRARIGYTVNRPSPGEALYEYWGPNYRAMSIRIAADGTLSRYTEPKKTTAVIEQ